MMTETVLSRSLRLMFASGAAVGLSLLAVPAMAQQGSEATMQRVEITGSSIKRIAAEGSLPVQTLTRTQIDQMAVSNVADLVAALPAMQGFITSSTSVNGGGGGVQTASVHAIGTQYTLVLLNGRRMAPYGTGSAVNLASIPLAAVERVEILTDGASTLYGSDAIAGVVNFILKKNQTDFNIEATLNKPQESGGQSTNFAISKGFGDLEKDGFNVLVAYSHDTQKQLNATQRDFAKSGVRKFSQNGSNFATWQTSINSTPANVEVVTSTDQDEVLNHDLTTTGKCSSPNTFSRSNVCRFDYPATVQLLPELKRDSVFASGTLKINDTTSLFGELVMSKFSNQARYAPAAQPLTVFENGVVNNNYIGAYNSTIVPILNSVSVDPTTVTAAYMYYRGVDAGGREDKYSTDAIHAVFGGETRLWGWDAHASFTHSQNTQKDTAVAGYISGDMFETLVRTGAYNPFKLQANGAAVLAPAVLHNVLEKTTSKIDVLSAGASHELFTMAGGAAMLGVGLDFTHQDYNDQPSEILQGPGPQHPTWTDVTIGGGTGSQALDASRNNWGSFAELLLPVTKTLEVTPAVRWDSYAAVDKKNVSYDVAGHASNPGKVGNDVSKATYKVSARWTPVQELLVRGSYGTGFKAPTMNQVADPLKNGGSSNPFPCPPLPAGDPRLLLCKPGSYEYGLLTNGNPLTGDAGLKPETSKQFTVGFRVEPVKSLSFGVDLWDVKLKNQIQFLSQALLFRTPGLANQYMVSYYDPIQKSNTLVAQQNPLNLASSHYQGLDWDATVRFGKTMFGTPSINWTGTYMTKADQSVPDGTGGNGIEHSVGRFNAYSDVTFRVISRAVFALKGDKMMNSLTANYRSGYHDQVLVEDDAAVRVVNPDGSIGGVVGMTRDVKPYMTLDYQLKATVIPNLTLTAGIKNLLDKDPPLSIRNAGGGNQVGYDGRYTDPLGRTFYLTAGYKF
ncbi:MAG: TonB-dependent receptor domain-containing protein [Massilia sp.]